MELIRSRFANVDFADLVDGETFFKILDSGMYDQEIKESTGSDVKSS